MEKNVTGLDELLAGFAAGTLAAPARALVGAHLELSGRNRSYVAGLEEMAGAALEAVAPVAVTDRDHMLAGIFAMEPAQTSRGTGTSTDPRLPGSLREIVDKPLDALPWKTLLPGVKECKFGEIDGCSASLLWVRAGRAMPAHTHEGTELTLVLQGGFKDVEGHFVRGDIAFANDDIDHKPIADEDEDCICFAVTEGSLRLTGPIGRFFAPFMR
ncbi:ChrR family anti-sigma-E factor [Roseibium litorale]|uniref:Cupin domain-containing protein n=1 Tax=Roseibium litorale TaxID=2803841 RepID=A0ABR9CHY8_9HYPH|nr:ChrR family anti-sigma-E factor [Roseibium litorale]MBD8889931.1 cupin domain-containing protein [Roseibium litorale]